MSRTLQPREGRPRLMRMTSSFSPSQGAPLTPVGLAPCPSLAAFPPAAESSRRAIFSRSRWNRKHSDCVRTDLLLAVGCERRNPAFAHFGPRYRMGLEWCRAYSLGTAVLSPQLAWRRCYLLPAASL